MRALLCNSFILLTFVPAGAQVIVSLGSGAATKGGSVALNISLAAAAGGQPADFQWTMSYASADVASVSVSAGSDLNAASKSLSCSHMATSTTCVAYGINENSIVNGVSATVIVNIAPAAPDANVPVSIGRVFVSNGAGGEMSGTASGGTISVSQPSPSLSGVSCVSGAVSSPGSVSCTVTLSGPAASGGAGVTLSSSDAQVLVPASVSVPAASASAGFTATVAAVSASQTAILTATAGTTSKTFSLAILPVQGVPAVVVIDANVSRDQSSGAVLVSPEFSTTSRNELVLAFIGAGKAPGIAVRSVSADGLTLALVGRTNVQSGTVEIWRAFSPAVLKDVTVTASLSANVHSSMTVMSFSGVDSSGTSGSGAIGALGSGQNPAGAPMATLNTTRMGSLVIGAGDDIGRAVARTPGAGQTIVHQYLANSVGDTFWVQMIDKPTAVSGSPAAISDTTPPGDPYNLEICEILPALAPALVGQAAHSQAVPTTVQSGPASLPASTSGARLTLADAATGIGETHAVQGAWRL